MPRTGPLETTGRCQPGDILAAINDTKLPSGGGFRADVGRLRDPQLSFPCRLTFLRPSTVAVCEVVVPSPPADGLWGAAFGREEEHNGGGQRPVLRSFQRLAGPLARRGLGQTACRPGRVLLAVNGEPVTEVLRRIQEEVRGESAGERGWAEVERRLRSALHTTPLPASLALRDMEAFAALRDWCVG